jgi:hypothetical protein
VAVERSVVTMTNRTVGYPTTDWGIDLILFGPDPLDASGVQVKGASSGLKVWQVLDAARDHRTRPRPSRR